MTDLLEVIAKQGIIEISGEEEIAQTKEGVPYYRIEVPYSEMMRMTQTISKVHAFMAKQGDRLIQPSGMPLSEYVQAHSRFVVWKGRCTNQNFAAAWTFGKVYALLFFRKQRFAAQF